MARAKQLLSASPSRRQKAAARPTVAPAGPSRGGSDSQVRRATSTSSGEDTDDETLSAYKEGREIGDIDELEAPVG